MRRPSRTAGEHLKRRAYAAAPVEVDAPCRDKTQAVGPNGECLRCDAIQGERCRRAC